MPLASFPPPANLTDLNAIPGGFDSWSQWEEDTFAAILDMVVQEVGSGYTVQFYDPTKADAGKDVQDAPIRWNGFPKLIESKHPNDFLAACAEADQLVTDPNYGTYRPQDEYLEWKVDKSAGGKITRIVFTCEGPEYWRTLADGYGASTKDPSAQTARHAVLLSLYRQYVDPNVALVDLLKNDGTYDLLNKWNTTDGCMHLSQPNNYLEAEIDIAAEASILREKNSKIITDQDQLIKCALYGEPGRNSDPLIGGSVNTLARQGAMITLQPPIGLYIDSFNPIGWTVPGGADPATFWTIERGDAQHAVRAVFEVPASAGFTVGDIEIGGDNIQYGGQVAKYITMRLTGVASDMNSVNDAPLPCKKAQAGRARVRRGGAGVLARP